MILILKLIYTPNVLDAYYLYGYLYLILESYYLYTLFLDTDFSTHIEHGHLAYLRSDIQYLYLISNT